MNRRGFLAAIVAGASALVAKAFADPEPKFPHGWTIEEDADEPALYGFGPSREPCMCDDRRIVGVEWPGMYISWCQCGGYVAAERMADGPHSKCCQMPMGMHHHSGCSNQNALDPSSYVTKFDCFDIGRMPDGTLVWLDR